MKQINIGFIGFGQQAATQHARYLVENCLNTVKIVAICGILHTDLPLVHQRLAHLKLSNIPIYPIKTGIASDRGDIHSIEELLENHPEINTVIISTPNAKHYYQVKECLERRIHVLVDKPMSLTYDHAKQLVRLASNEHGPYLVVSSQRRYEDVYVYAKKVINSNDLGNLINIDGVISHPQNWLQGWQGDPVLAGGTLWGIGWHALDTIIYLINRKAVAVDAALYYLENVAVETHVNALIFFEGGISVTMSVNLGAPKNSVYERLHIWGTRGILILERFKPIYDDMPPTVTHQTHDGRLILPDLTNAKAQKWAPTEAFINFLSSLKDPTVNLKNMRASIVSTGEDSLETVRLIEATYMSAENRRRVNLTEVE